MYNFAKESLHLVESYSLLPSIYLYPTKKERNKENKMRIKGTLDKFHDQLMNKFQNFPQKSQLLNDLQFN